jgi:copper chaperone CopZ
MFFDRYGLSQKKFHTFIEAKYTYNHLTLNLLNMHKQKLSAGLILFVYILIAVSCSGSGKKAGQTQEKQEVSVMDVSIGGMTCTGCEQTIQNNVAKLEGIRSVKASFKTGEAVIEYLAGIVDTTKIREAITGSGYSVKKFNLDAGAEGEKQNPVK